MRKRGPKPKRAANPEWSPELAYACGLMASDGCLSSDGRHMCLTSQDIEQLETFKRCLGLTNKISWKPSGYSRRRGSQVQFGDVVLYRWFVSIGITPRKTHTIAKVKIPNAYFFDYLRGEFDGDGSSHAYWDTRWRSSVSLYICFTGVSKEHLYWLASVITRLIGAQGSIQPGTRSFCLKYAKGNAKIIHDAMYYAKEIPYLKRKKEKLDRQWQANEMAKLGRPPEGFVKGGSVLRIA